MLTLTNLPQDSESVNRHQIGRRAAPWAPFTGAGNPAETPANPAPWIRGKKRLELRSINIMRTKSGRFLDTFAEVYKRNRKRQRKRKKSVYHGHKKCKMPAGDNGNFPDGENIILYLPICCHGQN